MRRRYVRVPAEGRDTVAAALVAGAVAACAGAVTFYLARIFLSREVLGPPAERPSRLEGGGDERGCVRE